MSGWFLLIKWSSGGISGYEIGVFGPKKERKLILMKTIHKIQSMTKKGRREIWSENCCFRLPQNSAPSLRPCLEPLLFSSLLISLTNSYPLCHKSPLLRTTCRHYFVYERRSAQLMVAGRIQALFHGIHLWVISTRLSLNSSKIQLIWFESPQQLIEL